MFNFSRVQLPLFMAEIKLLKSDCNRRRRLRPENEQPKFDFLYFKRAAVFVCLLNVGW